MQIDDKPERIGLRHPVDVGLVGDAKATLAELLPLLTRNDDRSFLSQAQEGMSQWWELMAARGTSTDTPMKPQVPAWALNDVLSPDPIICGDSGTVTTWAARQIKVRKGTPNRNRIALQMVKDMLDESTFDASPGHIIPGKLGKAVSGVVGKLRDRADEEHPK